MHPGALAAGTLPQYNTATLTNIAKNCGKGKVVLHRTLLKYVCTLDEDQNPWHTSDPSYTKVTIFPRIRPLKRSGLDYPGEEGGGGTLDAKTDDQADYHLQTDANFEKLI